MIAAERIRVDRSPGRSMVEAIVTETARGAVIHDSARLGVEVDEAWFHGVAGDYVGGRGTVTRVETRAGRAVLRHYRRGGLIAHLLGDRYLYLRRELTRPFREFRLMAWAARNTLPVPAPLAARVLRSGLWYRGELLVEAVADARTLAQCLESPARIDWGAIGAAIARVHAAGIHHADLNAHNLLLDIKGRVWVIDFDRGARRDVDRRWPAANLARLERSLLKLAAPLRVPAFDANWAALCDAHAAGMKAATMANGRA